MKRLQPSGVDILLVPAQDSQVAPEGERPAQPAEMGEQARVVRDGRGEDRHERRDKAPGRPRGMRPIEAPAKHACREGSGRQERGGGAEPGLLKEAVDLVGAGPQAKISSTRIREALRAGEPQEAARLLGHWWTVEGRVEAGDKRGRTIGFPTANVSLEGYLEPALGVYAVRVEVAGKTYDGVANFGRRPTFDKKDVLLEVHLFDFAGDLYGQQIVVAFIAHLRPEQKFAGLDALKAHIAEDARKARALLVATSADPPPL